MHAKTLTADKAAAAFTCPAYERRMTGKQCSQSWTLLNLQTPSVQLKRARAKCINCPIGQLRTEALANAKPGEIEKPSQASPFDVELNPQEQRESPMPNKPKSFKCYVCTATAVSVRPDDHPLHGACNHCIETGRGRVRRRRQAEGLKSGGTQEDVREALQVLAAEHQEARERSAEKAKLEAESPAKQPASKKPAAKKPAPKRTTRAVTKKPAAKKPAAKKPVAKKPAEDTKVPDIAPVVPRITNEAKADNVNADEAPQREPSAPLPAAVLSAPAKLEAVPDVGADAEEEMCEVPIFDLHLPSKPKSGISPQREAEILREALMNANGGLFSAEVALKAADIAIALLREPELEHLVLDLMKPSSPAPSVHEVGMAGEDEGFEYEAAAG
ncbi:MAG: hypothetical protein ACE366_16800 [Bradymonadia bacterium]